jgi:hypothetical protein
MSLQYTDALVRATVQPLLASVPITATENGAGVKLPAGVQGDACAVLTAAVDTAGTASTLAIKLQSSPDNATWTDIPGAVSAVGSPAAAVNQVIPFRPQEATGPWIRAVATVGAGSGATPNYKSSAALLSWVP